MFGALEVSVACPVLCDTCETIDDNSNSADTAASSGESGGKNAGAVVGIVILLLLLTAAVAFIYITRVRDAKDETAGGSNMAAAPVTAFENPMYAEPVAVRGPDSSMVAIMDNLHTAGLNDHASDGRHLQSTESSPAASSGSNDETHNETSYNAVEPTANSANVVVFGESQAGGPAEEAFGGFGEASSDAVGGAGGSAVQAVALFDYAAGDEEDVSFEKGDEFVEIEDAEEAGWLKGTVVRTGASGTFPSNYVKLEGAAAVNSGTQKTISGVSNGMDL